MSIESWLHVSPNLGGVKDSYLLSITETGSRIWNSLTLTKCAML